MSPKNQEQNQNNLVHVKGYTRNGKEVKAYVRTRPDNDLTNNLSYTQPTAHVLKGSVSLAQDPSLKYKIKEAFQTLIENNSKEKSAQAKKLLAKHHDAATAYIHHLYKAMENKKVPTATKDALDKKPLPPKNSPADMINKFRYTKNPSIQFLINNSNLFNKAFLKAGAFATKNKIKIDNLQPSGEMLDASLDFSKNAPKIENSQIVRNFKDTGLFGTLIKEKLKSQNLDLNTPGIVFFPESKISNDVANSKEIKDFLHTHQLGLEQNQSLKTTIRFDSNLNLQTAINNADVIASRDKHGDINIMVIDTYDFNKDENDNLVRMGRKLQETGKLDNYFSLILLKVPRKHIK